MEHKIILYHTWETTPPPDKVTSGSDLVQRYSVVTDLMEVFCPLFHIVLYWGGGGRVLPHEWRQPLPLTKLGQPYSISMEHKILSYHTGGRSSGP